jgi:hypothetical protein
MKQMGSVTSGKSKQYITVNVAVNAIGIHVPAEVIFPGSYLKTFPKHGYLRKI